ncbi:hypothetical protein B5V01_24175 [Mesorhizobium erdmanii]|uniref:Response regulatory domain-containing protein n=1 Tax=Mesorhizobium erdmanii TaxID=1777866 RepID=A0A4Q1UUI8_9HYPH|nr:MULTISPECIES: response regulator transcription factor [Mesorhizobium]RXT40322.1 hypothetical protein B5V01_24175 [Mesorhizobium erdmanii]
MVTTVFIVDDHPLLLRGLADLIARDSGYRVIGTALDGRSALTMIRQDLPDVAVIDLNMPGFRGSTLPSNSARKRRPRAV